MGQKTKTAPKNEGWINILSRGELYAPSEYLKNIVNECEIHFLKFHGSEINMERDPIGKFSRIMEKKLPDVPKDIIHLYSKTRVFIRIKWLNNKIQSAEKSF